MRHATTHRPIHRFAVAVIAAISAISATTSCAHHSLPRDAQASATSEAARRPPNVLFILADDMRPDAIGALADDGGSGASTEHLDALVARGTAFTNTVH
ncbi:MAG: Sulfatase, partial [Planctomycetota bacterium]